MVPMSAILCMAGALLLAFGLPVFLWGTVGSRVKGFLVCVLCGASMHMLFQLLLVGPVSARLGEAFPGPFLSLLGTALAGGAGYAVCRFALIKTCMRESADLRLAAGIGIGMGFAELLISVGIVYFNNLFFSILLNTGSFGSRMAAAGLNPELIAAMEAQLTGTPGALYLLSSFERVAFLAVHVLASVLLARLVNRGKTALGLLAAFGAQAGATLLVGCLGIWGGERMVYPLLSLLAAVAILFLILMVRALRQQGDPQPVASA